LPGSYPLIRRRKRRQKSHARLMLLINQATGGVKRKGLAGQEEKNANSKQSAGTASRNANHKNSLPRRDR